MTIYAPILSSIRGTTTTVLSLALLLVLTLPQRAQQLYLIEPHLGAMLLLQRVCPTTVQ